MIAESENEEIIEHFYLDHSRKVAHFNWNLFKSNRPKSKDKLKNAMSLLVPKKGNNKFISF